MPVTGTQIAPAATDMATYIVRLRRMIAEPTTTTYSDETLGDFIEARPVYDTRGVSPWQWDYTTTPPTQVANDDWIATYDLNAVAADVWEEKAAAVACDYKTDADGTVLERNQVYEQYMKIAQRFRSKRYPGALQFVKTQRELTRQGEIIETTPLVYSAQGEEPFNT